jgi:manganese/zinc/iron transport system substrate-binding protein
VVLYLGEELEKTNRLRSKSIRANTEAYANELNELNLWVNEQLTSLDSNGRVLITAHDAFGYFGRAYQLEVRGLQGISTVSEYGLKDISDLVEFISQEGIPAIFVESSVSDRSLKAVMEGCKAKGHKVRIGGTLFSDALGEAGTKEGSYVGMVKHNVTTIVEGLSERKK